MIAPDTLALLPSDELPTHPALLVTAAQQLLRSGRVLRGVLKQARADQTAPDERPFSDAQLHVLQLLNEEPDLGPGDLAVRCSVSNPAMSKILNTLEAQGLLTRRTDPTNRRTVRVSVTPAGQHELQRATTVWLGNLARALDPLSDAQLLDLITGLRHLASLGPPPDPA